ncbi:acyltransferase [Natronomonas sp.]|uniref:acyltransferase n=1 Tax=Natronomonas sp. TaxID=2184060 RepID=UPI003976E58A
MASLSDVYKGLELVGALGSVKSAYYSVKHTGDPTALQIHSNTIVDIDGETAFDINNRLEIGTFPYPEVAHSKFSTGPESSISHTGEELGRIGSGCLVSIRGAFSIGDSYIREGSHITCTSEVTIGDNCALSWDLDILDNDYHQLSVDGVDSTKSKPVRIEDDVWVGHGASINKGVTIHEGSVVACDSVVVSDVPPRTLVAGVPAEVVREDIEWVH